MEADHKEGLDANSEIAKCMAGQWEKSRHSRQFRGLRCTRWECNGTPLVWMDIDESRQTENGFLIAKVAGWFCPKCAAGFGGMPPNAKGQP